MSPTLLPLRRVVLLAATTVAGSLLVAGPLSASAVTRPVDRSARDVPGCVAAHLTITHGRREGAAGHRYDRFRITNTGATACRLRGYPTFRFRNGAGERIGFRSVPAGQPAHRVVLQPGGHTRTAVGTVNPGVVEQSACKPRRARSVDITLPHRPHVYNVPLRLRVCTTKQYRPTAYPVGL